MARFILGHLQLGASDLFARMNHQAPTNGDDAFDARLAAASAAGQRSDDLPGLFAKAGERRRKLFH